MMLSVNHVHKVLQDKVAHDRWNTQTANNVVKNVKLHVKYKNAIQKMQYKKEIYCAFRWLVN